MTEEVMRTLENDQIETDLFVTLLMEGMSLGHLVESHKLLSPLDVFECLHHVPLPHLRIQGDKYVREGPRRQHKSRS